VVLQERGACCVVRGQFAANDPPQDTTEWGASAAGPYARAEGGLAVAAEGIVADPDKLDIGYRGLGVRSGGEDSLCLSLGGTQCIDCQR
jgi:hypothetical protein